MFKRRNIIKMRGNKFVFRIVIRKCKKGLRTNAVKTTKRLNMRKNVNIGKPSISQENNRIIFIRKQISTIRNAEFNKVNRKSLWIAMFV